MITFKTNKQLPHLSKSLNPTIYWLSGVAFTFFIAFLGFLLAKLPGFTLIGQMASAIFLAVLYRQFFGYPTAIISGITFSSKKLLRLAIILYGLKLNIHIVLQDGFGLLIQDAGVILFAILLTLLLAKILKADHSIALLVGIGTGVCGAAAIAAVAPIMKSKDEDTAISVAMIALVGTIFSIVYILLRPILPLTDVQYGLWSGMSLHELAHVALAVNPSGEEALAMGLLAKLGRVFLLVPLSLLLIFFVKKRKQKTSNEKTKVDFPWFLLGFILMSMINTYVLGKYIPVSTQFLNGVSTFTTWCLTAAMVGLGLNISLRDIRSRAFRPLAAMTITSLCLSVLVFFLLK